MTRFNLFLILTVTFISALASADASLTGITTKRIGSDFFIEMSFNEGISEKNVTVQYDAGNIDVFVMGASSPRKHFKTVKDASIDHIAASNDSPGAMKIELAVNKAYNGTSFQKTTTFTAQSNRLLLRVGNPVSAAAEASNAEAPGDLIDKLMTQQAGTGAGTSAKVEAKAVPIAVPEEAVPVFKNSQTEMKEKTNVPSSLAMRMILSLLVVAAILGGCLYALKKWPGAKKLTSRSKMIEILAQHPLGPKKSVAVIRVAGETVLVGVTDNHISILKTLALLEEDKFQTALQTTVAKTAGRNRDFESEDFSMRGLKDIVNDRLKNMRSMT